MLLTSTPQAVVSNHALAEHTIFVAKKSLRPIYKLKNLPLSNY